MRDRFYEPLIQEEQRALEIRGFPVHIGGLYVLMDDVVTALREYAQAIPVAEQAALVHEVATWLQSGRQLPIEVQSKDLVPPEGIVIAAQETENEVTSDVERIEIFPSETMDGKKKWHARSIDTAGNVMKITHGSFDKTYVEKDAFDRWPGIQIYEVQTESERSRWTEEGKRGHDYRIHAGLRA